MSLEITRLQIVGLKSDLQRVIRELHALGHMQVGRVDVSDGSELSRLESPPQALRATEQLRLHLSHVRGLLDEFDVDPEPYEPHAPATVSLSEIQSQVVRLRREVEDLLQRRDRLERERDLLPRLIDTLRHLLPLMPDELAAPEIAWFGLLIDAGHRDVVQIIQEQVGERTDDRTEVASRELDRDSIAMLVATPREYVASVADMLDQENVSRLRLPPDLRYDAPDTAIATLQARLDHIPDELERIAAELTAMGKRWGQDLLLWRDILMDELARRDVLERLAGTEHAFVLEGWTPVKAVDALREALHEAVGERIQVQEIPVPEEMRDEVPVVMDNPRPAEPFEKLVTFLNTPRYEGVDPTILMALFMPLLFGLILGDAGYGAILLILALYLRQRYQQGLLRAFITMLVYGAAWSVVFGILFGEVFGTLGEQLGLHPILFHRDDPSHLLDLLLLTVGVGAAHVLLGLVVGVIGGLREGDRDELMEHGGQLIGLVALLTLVGVLANVLPQTFMTVGIAGLIVGLVLLIASLGWTGIAIAPVELVGLVGNVLSYLRIAAIGLASVYLAVVANEIAGAVGSLVIGVMVAALLHALNILLGAFSPTIHSLRLHYVEFFGQFYTGGGRPFEPFKARAGSTILVEE